MPLDTDLDVIEEHEKLKAALIQAAKTALLKSFIKNWIQIKPKYAIYDELLTSK